MNFIEMAYAFMLFSVVIMFTPVALVLLVLNHWSKQSRQERIEKLEKAIKNPALPDELREELITHRNLEAHL